MEKQNNKEILHQLSFNSHQRAKLFLGMGQADRINILSQLSKHVQRTLVNHIPQKDLVLILEDLDPDEATDIVQMLTPARRGVVVPKLREQLRSSVELLSQFDPRTAAGLMNLDYIQVTDKDTISMVSKRFKAHEQRTGRLPAVIVMRAGKVMGYLPGHKLGLAKPEEGIAKYARHIECVSHLATHEQVIAIFKDHPHNKVVVIGERGNVIGIIYSDDILRILGDQSSLYDFAGVSDEEAVTDPVWVKVRNRYKWLIINLGTAFLAAYTVGLFEDTISRFVLLAVYMPIVAGMGGNAGTQTLAVLVRGIALREIDLRSSYKALKAELGSGFVNGLINGLIVSLVVILVNRDYGLALVIGSAMIINLCVAAFFGTLVPLVMKHLGKDPATSATIFITTATDVLGFLAFLGLASLVL